MADPMRTVSFKLPSELDDALSELAKERNSTRSALVREALQALSKRERLSVTALVDDLGVTVDGPSDLSTNRKHLAGYGE